MRLLLLTLHGWAPAAAKDAMQRRHRHTQRRDRGRRAGEGERGGSTRKGEQHRPCDAAQGSRPLLCSLSPALTFSHPRSLCVGCVCVATCVVWRVRATGARDSSCCILALVGEEEEEDEEGRRRQSERRRRREKQTSHATFDCGRECGMGRGVAEG